MLLPPKLAQEQKRAETCIKVYLRVANFILEETFLVQICYVQTKYLQYILM